MDFTLFIEKAEFFVQTYEVNNGKNTVKIAKSTK